MTLLNPSILAIAVRVIINKSSDLENVVKETTDALLKFYDGHKQLKLTIDPSAVMFIAADGNYIKITYLENERVRVPQLRNSMKSFEADAAKHGFVRCHRSYYVNPRRIKLPSRGRTASSIQIYRVHPGGRRPHPCQHALLPEAR